MLLSIARNTKSIFDHRVTKPLESSEFKLSKSMKTFSFDPPLVMKGDWVIVLRSFEIFVSIFCITNENNKYKISDTKHEDEIITLNRYLLVDEYEKDSLIGYGRIN